MPDIPQSGAVVFVNDPTRLASFYAQVLGLNLTHSEPGWAILSSDRFRLVVHGLPPHIAAQVRLTTPPEAREDTPIKLIFGVASLPAALEQVQALGGVAHGKIWQLSGTQLCDCLDPEGNVFQLSATDG